jgi:hypothetical protein
LAHANVLSIVGTVDPAQRTWVAGDSQITAPQLACGNLSASENALWSKTDDPRHLAAVDSVADR